jgi:quercetin dioxygenase-like cupin family protein
MISVRPATQLIMWAVAVSLIAVGCASNDASQRTPSAQRAVVLGPSEGTKLWFQPASRDAVGDGAVITLKIDRVSVPHSGVMAAVQTLAADGIPVHAHTFEDELLYVVRGQGFAIVGDSREEIPLEAGSVVFVPPEEWHGVRNADPSDRMELLVVTTPSAAGGLADFFRNASVRPGHPPLDLSEEEFLALFHQYGMRVPTE